MAIESWRGSGISQWIHHTTSALVVAAVVFIAGNWYTTGNNVAVMAVELKNIQHELSKNNDIAMAALSGLNYEVHKLQEEARRNRERISVIEGLLEQHMEWMEGKR